MRVRREPKAQSQTSSHENRDYRNEDSQSFRHLMSFEMVVRLLPSDLADLGLRISYDGNGTRDHSESEKLIREDGANLLNHHGVC